jgi:hypothetical protein
VDEAVTAWYGALKAFALLQPEGLFQEGERGTKLLVAGVRISVALTASRNSSNNLSKRSSAETPALSVEMSS